MTAKSLKGLQKKLHYHFEDAHLLKMALSHRSCGGENNERLEFLGDAIVNMVIADILYQKYPAATEGELSRWRASLVNRDALALMAKYFKLGAYILLGQGEAHSGGRERSSILSCAMEAIIGAIYIDGGFHAISQCLVKWYKPTLSMLSSAASHKDPKTSLQEYLQRKRLSLPVYTVEVIEGEAHQQSFTLSCYVPDLDIKTFGKGSNRFKDKGSKDKDNQQYRKKGA